MANSGSDDGPPSKNEGSQRGVNNNRSRLTTDPRLDTIARQAMQDGGLAGLKTGLVTLTLSTIVRKANLSPIYNGLTLQFRVFLHMAAVMAVGLTTAEHSLSAQRARARAPPYPRSRSTTPPSDPSSPSPSSPSAAAAGPSSSTGAPPPPAGSTSRQISPSMAVGVSSSPASLLPSSSTSTAPLQSSAGRSDGPLAKAIIMAATRQTGDSVSSTGSAIPSSSRLSSTQIPIMNPSTSRTDHSADRPPKPPSPTASPDSVIEQMGTITYPQDGAATNQSLRDFQKQLDQLEKVNRLRLLQARRKYSKTTTQFPE